jgi:hypothetical protein
MGDLRSNKTGRFIKQSVKERFWSKVDKRGTDECWPWLAGKEGWGYGMFWFEGHTIHASRIAWLLTNGTIPENTFVCHSCDFSGCVNPNHLFLGTQKDNMTDRENIGMRHAHLPPINRGEKHPRAKLNNALVEMAREAYKSGEYGAVGKLAKKYDVNYFTLWNAASNKTWNHILP